MLVHPATLAMPRPPSWLRALAPYTYQIFLLVLIPIAFVLDTHTQTIGQQNMIGVCAWVILIGVIRFSPPSERRQVWIMVGIATCVEVWSSVIWGVYRYRFGNVPLFVPPGHGLVYLFALRSVRTPIMQKHGKLIARAAFACATLWAVFGLTLEPVMLNRWDVMGALCWPVFAWFMRRPNAPVYAAAFFVTSILEIWGTTLGVWAWQASAPISHIPAANPPSVISAGYCLMDFWSITLAAALPAAGFLGRWFIRHRPAPAGMIE